MISKEDESTGFADAEVTREDQGRINRFSRLHQREKVLIDEVAVKGKDKEDLEEISTELELADEDELVPYKIGDTFMHVPLPEAQEMLSQATEAIDKEVSELEESLQSVRDEMGELKVKLYARFGRSINLET